MLGERIRQLRKNAGLTQEELGKRLNISTSAVGMYEQNRRTPDHNTLNRLCEECGVTADFLLRDSSEDVGVLLRQLRGQLSREEGLMFDGVPLSLSDSKAVLDAMEIGAQIAIGKNGR